MNKRDDFDGMQRRYNQDMRGQTDSREAYNRQIYGQGSGNRPSSPKRPSRVRRATRVANGMLLVLGLVAFAIFLALFILNASTDLFGLNKPDGLAEITIPEGSSTGDIARILKEKGVIDSPFTFRLYSRLKGKDGQYNFGDFEMETDWGYDQIMLVLQTDEITQSTVTLTFIEGMSTDEIADILEDKGVCSRADFFSAMDTQDFGYEFEDLIPRDALRLHALEGYIFPDTYSFYVPEDPKSVIGRFMDNFNNKVTNDIYARMDELGMSLDEVITLASIVQKEAGQPKIMAQVASVFYNRMGSTTYPRLESDVTTNFIEDYVKADEPGNQAMIDAYDSFSRNGLPIGPVSNPGLDAIQAVLYPAETDYYFFVSDNAGQYYFAQTLEQHNANVYTVSQVNAQIKQQQDAEGNDDDTTTQ